MSQCKYQFWSWQLPRCRHLISLLAVSGEPELHAALCSSQWFAYTLPSLPHTGRCLLAHRLAQIHRATPPSGDTRHSRPAPQYLSKQGSANYRIKHRNQTIVIDQWRCGILINRKVTITSNNVTYLIFKWWKHFCFTMKVFPRRICEMKFHAENNIVANGLPFVFVATKVYFPQRTKCV